MNNPLELFARVILFGDLIFLAFVPTFIYLKNINSVFSRFTEIVLMASMFFAISYAILTIFTKGFVANTNDMDFNIPGEFIRRCHLCEQTKPERSHHCKICKKCIMKMDHHCVILGTCVHFRNHGHFIRFLFFTLLGHLNLLLFNIHHIYKSINNTKQILTYKYCTGICFLTLIAAFASIITGYHLVSQMKLVKENITSIEQIQRHNSKYRKIRVGPSPYDLGLYSNIVSIFGPAKYLFLWRPDRDGVDFDKTYNTYYWPLYPPVDDPLKVYETI